MTATTWSTPPNPIAPTRSAARRLLVRSFYLLINCRARECKVSEDAGDFRLLSPRAVDALRRLSGAQPFLRKSLSSWIGFRQIRVDYQPAPRGDGRSTWRSAVPDWIVDRRIDRVFRWRRCGGDFARACCSPWPRLSMAREIIYGNLGVRRRKSPAIGGQQYRRRDGAGRRATHHARRGRRIYRQDPL